MAGDHSSSCRVSSLSYTDEVLLEQRILETVMGSSDGIMLSPQESTLNVDLDFKQPFLELNRILEALHKHDLGPALE